MMLVVSQYHRATSWPEEHQKMCQVFMVAGAVLQSHAEETGKDGVQWASDTVGCLPIVSGAHAQRDDIRRFSGTSLCLAAGPEESGKEYPRLKH